MPGNGASFKANRGSWAEKISKILLASSDFRVTLVCIEVLQMVKAAKTRFLRVSVEAHAILKELAKRHHRSMRAQLDLIMRRVAGKKAGRV